MGLPVNFELPDMGILFLRKLVLELYKFNWEFDCYVFVRHGNGFSYFGALEAIKLN